MLEVVIFVMETFSLDRLNREITTKTLRFLLCAFVVDFVSPNYLISTVAPASSNFFLMAAASSLDTPSLTGFGAPSTRSLASFRPRLVTSRTTLITLIFLSPTAERITLNSVCSSAAGLASPPAAGTPPAAIDIAAVALTPYFSSRLYTRPEITNIVAWSIHSSTSLIVIAIFVQLLQSKPGSARILRAGRQLSARARWKRALPGNPQYNRGLIETFQFSLPHSFQIRNPQSEIRNPIFESVSKPGTGLAPAP